VFELKQPKDKFLSMVQQSYQNLKCKEYKLPKQQELVLKPLVDFRERRPTTIMSTPKIDGKFEYAVSEFRSGKNK
jgi:hypothetical protein